jgi:hypothetical protein
MTNTPSDSNAVITINLKCFTVNTLINNLRYKCLLSRYLWKFSVQLLQPLVGRSKWQLQHLLLQCCKQWLESLCQIRFSCDKLPGINLIKLFFFPFGISEASWAQCYKTFYGSNLKSSL